MEGEGGIIEGRNSESERSSSWSEKNSLRERKNARGKSREKQRSSQRTGQRRRERVCEMQVAGSLPPTLGSNDLNLVQSAILSRHECSCTATRQSSQRNTALLARDLRQTWHCTETMLYDTDTN